GVVMFEMVTGRLPFVGETPLATAVMRIREDPPSPRSLRPDLDARWDATILSCMARAPEARPATAADVVRGLREGMPRKTAPRKVARSRGWRWLPVAAGVFVVLAVVLSRTTHRSRPTPPTPPERIEVPGIGQVNIPEIPGMPGGQLPASARE